MTVTTKTLKNNNNNNSARSSRLGYQIPGKLTYNLDFNRVEIIARKFEKTQTL